MWDNRDRSGGLLTGLALGAVIGAGLTFLFGTKKGKEIRDNVREKYPEVFDRVDEVLDTLRDKYEEVVEEVKKVEEEVAEMSDDTKTVVADKVASLGQAVEDLGKKLESVAPASHRFHKLGRKL